MPDVLVDRDLLAELVYESAMYKLYLLNGKIEEADTKAWVKDLWDSAPVDKPIKTLPVGVKKHYNVIKSPLRRR